MDRCPFCGSELIDNGVCEENSCMTGFPLQVEVVEILRNQFGIQSQDNDHDDYFLLDISGYFSCIDAEDPDVHLFRSELAAEIFIENQAGWILVEE